MSRSFLGCDPLERSTSHARTELEEREFDLAAIRSGGPSYGRGVVANEHTAKPCPASNGNCEPDEARAKPKPCFDMEVALILHLHLHLAFLISYSLSMLSIEWMFQ